MKKTVFITGATGNMGNAGFKELYARKDRFDIRILARPSKKNKKSLAKYADDPSVSIIWGDLCCYEDVALGVKGADYVLHVGGMVSPAADYYPEKTLKVNVLAAENVAKAVLVQPNADDIKVVYIGSVAQYGDRRNPIHWGCAMDPMCASVYDMYSLSKCKAEKAIVDSGIKKWVSLRQSGILYPGIFKSFGPTAYHVPIAGVLEWATIEDSGRLLANVCEDDIPDEFWCRFYNISSGEQYRLSNYEFEQIIIGGIGLGSPEKVFEPQWFATRNFHGMWYTDADELEKYCHFRENLPLDKYIARMKKQLPWFYSFARIVPPALVKPFLKPAAYEERLGTQWWVEHNREALDVYYGSMEKYLAIKSWKQMLPPPMSKNYEQATANGEVLVLDKGWDTSKSVYSLDREEIEAAAEFRGGKFLGPYGDIGKRGAIFNWECEHGHRFTASLEFVLLGGGWCTECHIDKWRTETTAANRFVSQLKID